MEKDTEKTLLAKSELYWLLGFCEEIERFAFLRYKTAKKKRDQGALFEAGAREVSGLISKRIKDMIEHL